MAVGSGPSKLLVGGFRAADPSFEQYWVRPGGATVLAIAPEDRFTVIDVDGGQVAELTMLGPGRLGRGRGDRRQGGRARDRVRALVSSMVDGAREVVEDLAGRGLDPSRAMAVRLFDEWSPPGSEQSFRADREGVLIVAAPAGRLVDGAPPPSDLVVEVHRARPRTAREVELPAPLAEPRLDFRIDRSTARSYEVQAGEFIQVIDVQGKQCSDFLAFHRRKLDDGIERGLDATVTRTLMGNAYPTPGLFGKFYDADMDPLVEVVRDTVGRHDTFALACNAKYYEDMGYPGHVNCTDNFNGTLTVYEIAKRKGWPALNFFFNTAFTADNVLVSDEPWSRPGDYVLLRAMTDLVCASSACPDDVDPANAWNPTDVHVRVYAPEHRFSVAIAHRVTPEARPVLTQKTGFHPKVEALTKNLVEYNGYWLPSHFSNEGAVAEYWACREQAAIMDLSPLRKFEVLGPDAEALASRRRSRGTQAAFGRPGHLHRRVQRGRRDDRRRHGVPPGAGQLPVRRRRRLRRRLAEGAGGAARAARLGQALDRPAPQRRRPGAGEPRDPARGRVDPARAGLARRARVVPLPRGPGRSARRDPDRGLAHRLHGRARLRGLVPSRATPRPSGMRSGRPANLAGSRRSAWTRSTWSGSRRG